MPDWTYPETWQVGDTFDANTLNRRVRDQTSILLRRPLFVAHQSAALTLVNGDNAVTFDTIDVDDDGMAMTGSTGVQSPPVTNIYAQREGTYQIWYNTTFTGNGTACPNISASIWITNNSGTRRWDYQAKGHTTSGQYLCRSVTGTISLNVGEYFTARCFQNTGANMTMPVINNTPRIVVMWLGIT